MVAQTRGVPNLVASFLARDAKDAQGLGHPAGPDGHQPRAVERAHGFPAKVCSNTSSWGSSAFKAPI